MKPNYQTRVTDMLKFRKWSFYLPGKFISPSLRWLMGFNATFNNISAISWRSVLLVEETGIPRENHPNLRLP